MTSDLRHLGSAAIGRLGARRPPAAHDGSLGGRLADALRVDGAGLDALLAVPARDERDELATLQRVHRLHLAPIDDLDGDERFQHHPTVAALKQRLERSFLARLSGRAGAVGPVDDAVASIRAIASEDLVPPVYEWVASDASPDELVAFLAIEGGPDAGFDDLVAVCQVGLDGQAKLELARNYWDEMGRGELREVHTELYRAMARALDLDRVRAASDVPIEAARRAVLHDVLATNRALQPELLGALGLTELQAGPRCRKVLAGLARTGLPAEAVPFYDEHARTDPHHGKAWLDHAVGPLASNRRWAEGMVRGARWRALVNADLFAELERRFVTGAARAA